MTVQDVHASALLGDIDIEDTQRRLRGMLRRLLAEGYGEYLTSFSPAAFRPVNWRAFRHNTLPEARMLVDFFLLNEPVFARRLDEALGEDWRALLDLGIAAILPGDVVRIQALSLFCFNGVFVFVDSPNQDPNIYFGDDSIGLFTRITALPGERVLDLCSGSGIQALNAARSAAAVDAVEVNPVARRVLEVNVLLNGRAGKVRAYGGSLFDSLAPDARYDLITANPPLVPFPEGVEYPFVGHGGADGLIVTRKILAGLPVFLTDGGRAQIIGLSFSDGKTLSIQHTLCALAAELELDISVTLLAHVDVLGDTGALSSLVYSAAPVARYGFDAILERLRKEMTAQHATHLTPYFLLVRRGTGRVSFQNLSRGRTFEPWHLAS